MVNLTGDRPAHVREANSVDAQRIAKIQSQSILETVRHVLGAGAVAAVEPIVDEDDIRKSWTQTISGPTRKGTGVLVAEDSGVSVGFAAVYFEEPDEGAARENVGRVEVEPHSAVLLAFDVDRAHMRKGHGSRMLSAVVDTCREDGIAGLIVWIIGEDEARVRFFQKAGFAPVGVSRTLPTPGGDLVEHMWYALL